MPGWLPLEYAAKGMIAAAVETTALTDISDTNLDINRYLGDVSGGDTGDAITDSHSLVVDSNAVVADLKNFQSPSGPYFYTASGWAQADAQGNPSSVQGPPPSGSTGDVGSVPSGVAAQAPPSGTIDLGVGNVGTLNVSQGPWTFSGAVTLDALNDSGTVTMAPSSGITADSVTLSGAASAEVANANQVTFGGPGETLKLDGPNINVRSISGFTANDTIDFPNEQNLTLSAQFYVNSTQEIALYSGSTQIATLQFAPGFDEDSLEPQADGSGGTKIVIDPTNVQLSDPAGSNVDWSFIHSFEGINGQIELAPSVPPGGLSGVTVGLGVDFGGGVITPAVLTNLFGNWNADPNLSFLAGTIGHTGSSALADLNKGPVQSVPAIGPQSTGVSLTTSQANALTTYAEQATYTTLVNDYNTDAATYGNSWSTVPGGARTAITDMAYNFGLSRFESYDFWQEVIKQNWTAAQTELRTWGGPANLQNRRAQDLQRLQTIPQLMVGPPLPTPVTQTGTPTAANSTTYNFSVADTSTLYALDPSGSEFTLVEEVNSPKVSSIQLPSSDAASYAVSYQTGTTWSAPQVVAPAASLAFPAGGATGVQVTLLDSSGNPLPSPTNFTYYLTFASAGAFSGTVQAPTLRFAILDTTSNVPSSDDGEAYTGPVSYLQSQYIYTGTDNVNITASVPNVFIKSGPGEDALAAQGGSNVLDGGTGSNFLVGASGADGGTDTFFTDARDNTAVWNTLVNFHTGDSATLWGFVPGTSSWAWDGISGAAGYTGATLRSDVHGTGTTDASITFAGLSMAQAQGLQVSTGTVGGQSYLYFHNPGV